MTVGHDIKLQYCYIICQPYVLTLRKDIIKNVNRNPELDAALTKSTSYSRHAEIVFFYYYFEGSRINVLHLV